MEQKSLSEIAKRVLQLMHILPPSETETPRLPPFLDRCAQCNKQLSNRAPIYMYGDLQGFCSPGCRNSRIDLDEEMAKASK
ncbi:hypothetical protein C4D60_Mb04t05270 [Musa balbisiana]|uniref:FLZ-type domain-containing protein n=1 Tax=Musa balbisiana TaxID=52838 RepID=A0A4S8K9S7_MUSBA|nr:hypothetical protein C4D60_Mb04t05270 [Musa balbisiana]